MFHRLYFVSQEISTPSSYDAMNILLLFVIYPRQNLHFFSTPPHPDLLGPNKEKWQTYSRQIFLRNFSAPPLFVDNQDTPS